MRDTILEMLHRRPFQPFRIVMASGDKYDVENPDLVATGRSQVNVYLPRSDRFFVLRLSQITSIEALEPAA